MQRSLFEPDDSFRRRLAEHLRALAARGIFLGGSSWKYPGWLGSIYSAERYRANGKLSQKSFEQECLVEYSETFPIVSGDFAFYQFPTRAFWQKLFRQVSEPFLFAFKAPEEITLPSFPKLARYGPRAGAANPGFLNAEMFRTQFLDLLLAYRERVAVIVFEFGAGVEKAFESPDAYAAALESFFGALPREFRYAVEIRTPAFLSETYFSVLRKQGVAHVFNSWTAMPDPNEQMALSDSFTAGFTVARALLRKGRTYDESVSLFSPYEKVVEPNHEVRAALRNLLVRAKQRAEPTFIFVNNRLEGFAPGTIAAVIEGF